VEQQFYPPKTFKTVEERRLLELKQIYSAYALSSIALTFEDLKLDTVIKFFLSLVLTPVFLVKTY
jgi:hypothetical protein